MAKATQHDTIVRLTPEGELVYRFTVSPEKQKYDVACFRKNEFDPRTFFNLKLDEMEECYRMDNKQLGYLVFLGTFLHYGSPLLYLKAGGTKPVTLADLPAVLNKHPKTAKAVSNSLIKADLIELVDFVAADGRNYKDAIQLKNTAFFKGPRDRAIAGQTAKAFDAMIKQLYVENGPALLGALTKLVPFADTETNLIVSNPQRCRQGTAYEEPIALSMVKIAEILGTTRERASRLLHGGRVGGHSVFIQLKNYSGYLTKLSPEVFCKMEGPVAEAVLYDFTTKV